MAFEELVMLAQRFHRSDRAAEISGWSSEHSRGLLGEDWGDVEVVDSSDYNYDFCDSFDFVFGGRVLISVDISHLAPVFRITGWGGRGDKQKTSTVWRSEADATLANVRARLLEAGLVELSRAEQSVAVGGVNLELSGPDEVTLGKCLFKDYDGPPTKGNGADP